jgi:hypothetical protein
MALGARTFNQLLRSFLIAPKQHSRKDTRRYRQDDNRSNGHHTLSVHHPTSDFSSSF